MIDKGDWTPASERMPELHDVRDDDANSYIGDDEAIRVLVCDRGWIMEVMLKSMDGEFICSDGELIDITKGEYYWMPLPARPQEKSDD